MQDFDEDSLDVLDDDGDGIIEMGLFFDEHEKKMERSRGKQPGNSGCRVMFLGIGSLFITGLVVARLMV